MLGKDRFCRQLDCGGTGAGDGTDSKNNKHKGID
jgi:hypothetical protein